jgi:ferrous iron transport protein B
VKKVALLGNSNVGKSTLFNKLTGSNQKTVNAQGTTVTVEDGQWGEYQLIDLPGLISMFYISPDEEVAANAVMHRDSQYRPDIIILMADAMHLSRALYILAQAKSSCVPIILGISMLDIAKRHGMELDLEKIKEVTHVEAVVALDSRRGIGLDKLKTEVDRVSQEIDDGLHPPVCQEILDVKEWAKSKSEKHFAWVTKTEHKLGLDKVKSSTRTDKLDKILLHKFWGIIIFFFMMFVVFELTTTVSNPIIDLIDVNFRSTILKLCNSWLSSAPNWIETLIDNVVVEAIVTVCTFLPPMFFMFFFLALLESSGYLSRAAFVSDRIMRLLGLDGRALIPIILGYGCNLPAVSATKALPNSKSRVSTGYLIPFTLCSARLAVFVVLAHAFFPDCSGLVVFSLYVISIFMVVVVGIVMNKFKSDNQTPLPFLVSLTTYQLPLLGPTLKSVGIKLVQFIKSAGSIITIVLIILWGLQSIPSFSNTSSLDKSAQTESNHKTTLIENSLYGDIAKDVSFIFKPLGFGDWHVSSAVIAGFVAKEVVISNLDNAYGDEDYSDQELGEKITTTFKQIDGDNWELAGFCFLLFVLLYVPCAATIGGLRKEFGWKMAVKSVVLNLSTAYILTMLVYQIGSRL